MEDDLAAEEENKLINEVCFTGIPAQRSDLIQFVLAGIQNMVSTTVPFYRAMNLPSFFFSSGRRTRRIYMIWSSRTRWTGRV